MKTITLTPYSTSADALYLLACLAQWLSEPLGIGPEKLFDEMIAAGIESASQGRPVEATVAATERACGLAPGSIKAASDKLQGFVQ